MKFSSMKLDPILLETISELGFKEPTEIQVDAIPPALKGRDVLACAKTGSGKTAAFVLPILHHLLHDEGRVPEAEPRLIRCLILAPTRELTAQVAEHTVQLAEKAGVSVAAVYGGVAMGPQIKALDSGIDILVATPGRLLDHMEQGNVSFDDLSYLVLDEADRMLDMGFLPEVRRILEQLPAKRQNLLFSATMPGPIAELADEMLDRPTRLNIERLQAPPEGVRQAAFPVPEHLKRKLMLHILEHEEVRNLLIFTRTKHRVNKLAQFLKDNGIACDRLHGSRTQPQRTAAMKAFKDGSNRVLVATNLAARGIDVIHLSHVLSFDVPQVPDEYIHRVGRTARADLSGDALTFYSPEEEVYIRDIEKALGHALPKVSLPDFDYTQPGDDEVVPGDRVARLRKRREEKEKLKLKPAQRRRGRSRGRGKPPDSGGARGTGQGAPRPVRNTNRPAGDGERQPAFLAAQYDRQFGGSVRGPATGAPRSPAPAPDRRGGGYTDGNSSPDGYGAGGARRRRGRGGPPFADAKPQGQGGPRRKRAQFRHDENQPVIPAQYDLPERDEGRPRRPSHQPAALSGTGRRFLGD